MFDLQLAGCQKCHFLLLPFSFFLNFKWLFSKLSWKNQPFFCYVINIFDQHTFGNETAALLKMFEFLRKRILFLFFPKLKRYYNLTFDETLKWLPFEYTAKFVKKSLLFWSKIVTFDMFFKRQHEESFEDLQINSKGKFQFRTIVSHKMAAL